MRGGKGAKSLVQANRMNGQSGRHSGFRRSPERQEAGKQEGRE